MKAFVLGSEAIGFRDQKNRFVRELIDNGEGLPDDTGTVWTPPHGIYDLLTDAAEEFDAPLARYLGLPPVFAQDVHLSVAASGLSDRDFSIEVQLYREAAPRTPKNRLPYRNRLCFLVDEADNPCFTLHPDLYRLISINEEFARSPDSEQSYANNLHYWALIRPLAEKVKATLDPVLNNEYPETIGRVAVDIDSNDDGTFRLVPKVQAAGAAEPDQSEIEGFDDAFRRSRRAKSLYSIQDGDQHTRVSVPPDASPALKAIKSRQRMSRDEALDVVRHPERVFEGIEIDFDPLLFSDRVKGIGLPTVTAIPFITRFESQWIPGAFLDEGDEGTTHIPIPDWDTLSELDEAIQHASDQGEPTVRFHDADIPIDEAREIRKVAEEQLRDPSTPHEGTREGSQKPVLLIKENIFQSEFTVDEEITDVRSEFEQISTLKAGAELKRHQTQGVGWMQYMYRQGAQGVLLADDMGLGKTLQVLYFLEWFCGTQTMDRERPALCLLIVPTSLIQNWEEEHALFFAKSDVTVLPVGPGQALTAPAFAEGYRDFRGPVVAAMSYETLRNEQIPLGTIPWDVVVIDEAQRIKNPATAITRAVKAQQRTFAVALTGTPVENSFFDLWCIFDFIVPGRLGTAREFGKRFGISKGSPPTDPSEVGRQIREEVDGHFLRRIKENVLSDLPPKKDSLRSGDDDPFRSLQLVREMPVFQLDAYRDQIAAARASSQQSQKTNEALRQLQAIRRVSDHPRLNDPGLLESSPSEVIAQSARLQATMDVLEHVRDRNEKVILFAEFKRTQRMLAHILDSQFGLEVSVINGDTPSYSSDGKESRQRAIKRFNLSEGFNAIVMSPIAAGVGLNVTGANHVIHYSRHWNPAREQQATDRAYRIGQERPVYVYYPQAVSSEADTFDVVLNRLLSHKLDMASATLYPTTAMEVKVTDLMSGIGAGQQ